MPGSKKFTLSSKKDISSSEGGIKGWGKLKMRAGWEKVEGILLDGFIFLYEKGELEYGMVRGKGLEKPLGEREGI